MMGHHSCNLASFAFLISSEACQKAWKPCLALPKPKVLEGEYWGIPEENHSPSHPPHKSEQLASTQPVR